MCSCRGPNACKQGRRIYNTLLLQAMALYIHGPLRCKNLLGRIPNPHSCHALAAPQPTHPAGGRSCTDQQHHTPPQHRNRTPSTTRTPTIKTARRHPGHTQHTPTQPRSAAQPPTLEAVQHPQPHTIRPPDSTKARPTITPDRLFLLHDGTGHRPADTIRSRPGDTLQSPRQPAAQSARLPLWASCRMFPGLSGLHPVP